MANKDYLIWFQFIIYILLSLCTFSAYLFSYTDATVILPFMFVGLILFIICLNALSGIYLNSLYSLFLVSLLLFFGGRFFSIFLGNQKFTYELDFFVYYQSDQLAILKLGCYLVLGIIFLDLGYRTISLKRVTLPPIPVYHNWSKVFCLIALLMSPIFIIELIFSAKDAFVGGYLSSKEWQTQSYNFPLSSLAQTLFGIAFGYSIVCGKYKKVYLFIYFFIAAVSALIGARGPFMIAMLFALWMHGDFGNKKINVIKLASVSLVAIVGISYFIQIYSYRSNGLEFETDLIAFLSDFFYDQGVSMMVFDVSMQVTDYPWLSYFQSFFPGSSAIAALFVDVEYYMSGFQHYMAKSLNPELFSYGYGLDWTLFSDFYVFGGENLLGYCIMAYIFGCSFSLLNNSRNIEFWLILTCSIFSRLIFLPRSSFSILFPFIIYYLFFLYLMPRLKLKR